MCSITILVIVTGNISPPSQESSAQSYLPSSQLVPNALTASSSCFCADSTACFALSILFIGFSFLFILHVVGDFPLLSAIQ